MCNSGFETAAKVAQQMDFFLGLPSLLLDPDEERRIMYGKAGAFRWKPYGMEYRVMSNFWLGHDSLIEWVFQNATQGVERMVNGEFLPEIYGDIQDVINNSDKDVARELIAAANILMPESYHV
jgi:hypothetical protein